MHTDTDRHTLTRTHMFTQTQPDTHAALVRISWSCYSTFYGKLWVCYLSHFKRSRQCLRFLRPTQHWKFVFAISYVVWTMCALTPPRTWMQYNTRAFESICQTAHRTRILTVLGTPSCHLPNVSINQHSHSHTIHTRTHTHTRLHKRQPTFATWSFQGQNRRHLRSLLEKSASLTDGLNFQLLKMMSLP